jgi:hypothetical protein
LGYGIPGFCDSKSTASRELRKRLPNGSKKKESEALEPLGPESGLPSVSLEKIWKGLGRRKEHGKSRLMVQTLSEKIEIVGDFESAISFCAG